MVRSYSLSGFERANSETGEFSGRNQPHVAQEPFSRETVNNTSTGLADLVLQWYSPAEETLGVAENTASTVNDAGPTISNFKEELPITLDSYIKLAAQ